MRTFTFVAEPVSEDEPSTPGLEPDAPVEDVTGIPALIPGAGDGDVVPSSVGPSTESRISRKRRWRLAKKATGEEIDSLARELKLQPATATVLANRGYKDPDAAKRFLHPSFADLPDPGLMKNMDAAVGVLMRALREKRRIVCHGDYDVDGVSGASVLVEFLRGVGADVCAFIPDRRLHGYGFTSASLAECAKLGAKVIVTCDCGTASVETVDEAASLGIEVVITDHHEPGPILPRAAALLNPKQPGETFPDGNLCGTGVAFFLIIGLRRALREAGHFAGKEEPNLKALLDIVALATIGDVVPLRGVNRVFTKEGFALLARGDRPGILALQNVSGTRDRFTETAISFALAPRINAAGRLSTAAAALDLLLTRDADVAKALAQELDGENKKRQDIEAQMLSEALEMIRATPSILDEPAIVLASESWHMGVVGIIAARLVDRFHRPSIALAIQDGVARGSARSIRGFNLYEALTRCADHLAGYGGHFMAAGMTVTSEKIAGLRGAFIAEAKRRLTADDLVPELTIDLAVETGDVNERLISELALLGPHGAANPEPVLLLRRARIQSSKIVGTNHLKLEIAGARGRLEAIAFGFADARGQLPEALDLAFVPQRREWQGLWKPELRVRDLSIGSIERVGLD